MTISTGVSTVMAVRWAARLGCRQPATSRRSSNARARNARRRPSGRPLRRAGGARCRCGRRKACLGWLQPPLRRSRTKRSRDGRRPGSPTAGGKQHQR